MNKAILCVIDQSPELVQAVRHAAGMAKRRQVDVAFLYTLEPTSFQHWAAVENLMREERRAEAEQAMQKWAMMVEGITGHRPVSYIREGNVKAELLKLLEEEPDIGHLVLAVSTGNDAPGPLISVITAPKTLTRLRVPVTILPASSTGHETETPLF